MAVFLIVVLTWPSSVPKYRGRPVTAWINASCSSSATQQQIAQASEAVRAAGTNALDYWVVLLSATNEAPLVDFWNSTIGRNAKFHRQTIDEKWGYAFCALYFLGPDAKPAIPQLTKLLGCRTMVPNEWATVILLGLGPKGVEAVTNAIANTNCSMRSAVIVGTVRKEWKVSLLRNNCYDQLPLGSVAAAGVMNAVVPALERCLDDPDLSVRVFGRPNHWAGCKRDPERAVPALAAKSFQNHQHPGARHLARKPSAVLGKNHKTARAQVASFLNDSDPNVSIVASNALQGNRFWQLPSPITLFGASRQLHLRLRARRLFVVRGQNRLDRRIDFRVSQSRNQLTQVAHSSHAARYFCVPPFEILLGFGVEPRPARRLVPPPNSAMASASTAPG